MSKDFTATITNTERAKDFEKVFGTATVYIESFIPTLAELPGLGSRNVYKLDMKLITPEQRSRLIDNLSYRFMLEYDEVVRLLAEHGVPILAEDCIIEVAHPQKWID